MICFPVWENHHLRTQNRIRCSCSAHFLAVESSYACRWTLCLCYSNSSPGCLKLAMLGNFLWTLWICACFSMQNLPFYTSADAKQVDRYQVDANENTDATRPQVVFTLFSFYLGLFMTGPGGHPLGASCAPVVTLSAKVLEDMAISNKQPEPRFYFIRFHSWFQTLRNKNPFLDPFHPYLDFWRIILD